MYDKYKKSAQFFFIYIEEAHPIGLPHPDRKLKIHLPKNQKERAANAFRCVTEKPFPLPTLIDNMDATTDIAYDAYPVRIYIVGKNGKIAYKGGHGPAGFKAKSLSRQLKKRFT